MSDPYSPEWLSTAGPGGYAAAAAPSPTEIALGRPVPAVYPVVLWTLAFSILAAPSAAMRGFKARASGGSAAPYWIAWVVTVPGGMAVWFAAMAIVAVSLS